MRRGKFVPPYKLRRLQRSCESEGAKHLRALMAFVALIRSSMESK
jgi:hypothetical protein